MVEAFRNAIKAASKGVKHTCEWLWVDIACIPQKHDKESEHSKATRDQEIGRQVEIFQRAEEAFAWFSSFNTTDLYGTDCKPASVEDVVSAMNTLYQKPHSALEAQTRLIYLDQNVDRFERWMSKWLEHPWFKSLWTLQEMVLRQDAWVLFDDGLLHLDKNNDDVQARRESQDELHPLRLRRVKDDAWMLKTVLTDHERIETLHDAEIMAARASQDTRPRQDLGSVASLLKRLQDLLDSQVEKGLTALKVEIPNSTYSMAQYRRATKPLDRIFGIVQIYGISCSPDPAGDDDSSKLQALQEEFAMKLIAKAPVLSQLFIHTLQQEPPSRSWLITQNIKADDPFWHVFSSEFSTRNHFTTFEIRADCENNINSLALSFAGKAWPLGAFVESSDPCSSKNTPEHQKHLFTGLTPGFPETYRGLMLDQHVSKAVLGRVVDYFDDHQAMLKAVHSLHETYCEIANLQPFAGNQEV
ncbi:unnamed protein product [Alternaria alternata]